MRTFIQIDVQNLFFSAKDLNKRIDFLKIKEHFIKTGEDITGLIAYIIRTPDAKSDKFESFLKSLNYELNIKQAVIGYSTEGHRVYKGTDQDLSICIDCLENIDRFDKWVLMSGDGDFIDLCKHLKKKGKIIEVWSIPGSSFNKKFCDYADMIHFLNENFFFARDPEDKLLDSNPG
jgi:uncharacterized LabA/DUF88 family protein